MYPPYLGYTNSTTVADLDTWLPADGRTVSDMPTYLANNVVYTAKDFGCVGNGTSDYAALNTLVSTTIPAAGGTVRFGAGTYLIDTNLSIPTTVALQFDPGATLKIATGITVTINGPVMAGSTQIFTLVGTGAAVCTQIPMLLPEWWGAIANGSFDCKPAVQSMVDSMVTGKTQTAFFGPGTYYFGNPVVLSSFAKPYRFTGASMASEFSSDTAAVLTGANGLEAIFKATANSYSLEVDHLEFHGNNNSTGVVSAIKSTASGQPARPLSIHHCTFTDFNKAIQSVTTSSTGICNVHIKDNVFQGGVYALYSSGSASAIMNLDFENNVSEQGGSIYISNANGASGTLRIANNLMEGQSEAIVVLAGLCQAIIERNYFEQCTGDIVSFSAGNAGSYLRLEANDYNGATGSVTVSNCQLDCRDNITVNGTNLYRKSRLFGSAVYPGTTPATFINNVDIRTCEYQHDMPTTLTGGTYTRAGTTLAQTMLGRRGTATFTTNSGLYSISSSLAIGDFVIVTALVKSITANTVSVIIYDNNSAYITQTNAISLNTIGEYTLILAGVKASATSTGNFKVRFQVDSTNHAEISDFYTYMMPALAAGTPVYAFLPRTEASGQATIASGTTSITVTHGMAITPVNVRVTASANIGALWVTNITSTQFTINCATAPGSGTTVYWDAN